ncbi:MAG: N-acyl homoserine lactonase family protein [Gammaproteobacteria bacterium]|nr:N-acyl homoserine lactonase family protein [Gammaproteobacteria bacterium]
MESKTYRVQPLLLGEAEVGCALDVFWGMNKDQGRVTVPILAFLIEGGTDPILVDAGMRSAERAMSIHRLGLHRLPLGMSLPDQLAKYGVKAEEVKTVILTHLHYDHCGGCELLPNARIVVQRSELAAAAAPMGPRTLDIGSRELFYDRQDVAAMVDTLWDRVELLEGDTRLFPGIECVLYPNSHTPGSQCVYIDSMDGVIGCVGDMVRKVDLNVRKAIPPGIYYGLEEMQRAMRDIALRGDIIYPAHDPLVLEPDREKRIAALSPGKPWP